MSYKSDIFKDSGVPMDAKLPRPMDAKLPRAYSVQERLAMATKELEAVRAEAEAVQQRQWFLDGMNAAIRQHAAAVHMLSDIRDIGCGSIITVPQRLEYAEFRAELSALAKEYGYKIALVGDKKYGCVVAV